MAEPNAKRQRKAAAAPVRSQPTMASALSLGPEIFRSVRSFLTLKDALVLRSTCRQLVNDSNDAFRYSHLFRPPCHYDTVHSDFTRKEQFEVYVSAQYKTFVRIALENNVDKLLAMLQNETFPAEPFDFLGNIIKMSSIDIEAPISVLLEDGRFPVSACLLEMALRRDFSEMAAALQRDARVQAALAMCATCLINIGAYECAQSTECVHAPRNDNADSNSLKYCRTCVLADNRFFKCGSGYMCPGCFHQGNYQCCEACQGFVVFEPETGPSDYYNRCVRCQKVICISCFSQGQGWHISGPNSTLCPYCVDAIYFDERDSAFDFDYCSRW